MLFRSAWLLYLAGGVLMAFTPWPMNLAAIAVIPYLVIVAPHWNITDETCETANRGWRKFIWLNYFAGFVVTQLLIFSAIL